MNIQATNSAPTLTHYLLSVFVPQVLLPAGSRSGTVDEYKKAVRRFVRYCGCEVRLHDVDEFLIERACRSWLIEGLSHKTAKAWSIYVKRVVRDGSPGKCMKAAGKRPHEAHAVTIAGLSADDLRKPDRSLLRFLEDVYSPRRMIGCKQSSVDQIRWTINRFAKYLGRPPLLDDLTNDRILGLMAWIINVRRQSVSTANNSRKDILSLWNYARKRNLVRTVPDDCEKLKRPKNLPTAWTIDELSQIISAAKKHTSPKLGMYYPAYVFFPAMLLAMYDTGLRLTALLSVRRCDWRPERREITAFAETQKQAVAQTFVMSSQTAEAIERMMTEANGSIEPPETLFPWPIRKDAIHEHFRKILSAAGLYRPGEDTWHKMRRTCATHLTARIGIEAACRQLGHSSVEMTRRYVDPRLTGHHNAADSLPRPEMDRNQTS